MRQTELADWEENFCLPFYKGGWQDLNTVYLDTQKFYASCCENGIAKPLHGIYATSCGTPWAGLNLGFVSQPVRRLERFLPQLKVAAEFYRECSLPWMLVVPDQWVAPGAHTALEALLQQERFQLAMEAQAVVAESRPPAIQPKLAVEPAHHGEDWETLASINAQSWKVPLAWVKPLLCSPGFQEQARGWLGRVDGNAVSCAVTFPSAPYTFFAWVATLPEYRKRGYGDSLIRTCRSEAPLFCLSSPQALRVWEAAGFKPMERFRLYMAPA